MKYMEIMTPSSSYVQNLIKKLSPPLGKLFVCCFLVLSLTALTDELSCFKLSVYYSYSVVK